MTLCAAAAALLLSFAQVPAARRAADPGLLRIHLRNGDYFEARLQSETATEMVFRVEDGLMLIRKYEIARIETPKLRNHESPAPPRAPGAEGAGPRPKYVILVPSNLVHSVRFKVDAILDALHRRVIDRDDAVRRVLECGPEAAIHLTALLEVLDADFRSFATQCLSLLKNPETVPSLLKLFDSEIPAVRVTAAVLTGMMGDKGAGRRLCALLRDRVPSVRAAAAAALDKLDDPAGLEHVAPLCSDPDPEARAAALEATVQLARRHEMRENLLWALDRALRWPPKGGEPDILKAVGASGDPEAWTLAIRHLSSSSEKARAAAAMAIAELAAPQASKAVLEQMAAESQPEPRIQLAFAAERLKIAEAAPRLVEWLAEPDESVRRAALRALRALSGENYGEDPAPWREWVKSR
ncbi:MAG TPA: HEAT repeat domain-containing protein [Planctomycetota bacterium]|nr:HEAT repeat domain-containing protein [Planctomycetota bacterium]